MVGFHHEVAVPWGGESEDWVLVELVDTVDLEVDLVVDLEVEEALEVDLEEVLEVDLETVEDPDLLATHAEDMEVDKDEDREDDNEEKAALSMGVAAAACGALRTLSANEPRHGMKRGRWGWGVGDFELTVGAPSTAGRRARRSV
jgi:hypothetical protein